MCVCVVVTTGVAPVPQIGKTLAPASGRVKWPLLGSPSQILTVVRERQQLPGRCLSLGCPDSEKLCSELTESTRNVHHLGVPGHSPGCPGAYDAWEVGRGSLVPPTRAVQHCHGSFSLLPPMSWGLGRRQPSSNSHLETPALAGSFPKPCLHAVHSPSEFRGAPGGDGGRGQESGRSCQSALS